MNVKLAMEDVTRRVLTSMAHFNVLAVLDMLLQQILWIVKVRAQINTHAC